LKDHKTEVAFLEVYMLKFAILSSSFTYAFFEGAVSITYWVQLESYCLIFRRMCTLML